MSDRARYACCDLRRRNAVDQHPTLNGLDAVEVIDRDLAPTDPLRQRTLLLFCLKSIAGAGLTRDNVRIEGGERLRNPEVEWAEVASAPPAHFADAGEAPTAALVAALAQPDHVLVVRVANAGDYSSYTATLVAGSLDDSPPANFDPRLTEIEFSFKAECPSDFDCRVVQTCPQPERTTPDIDYLARDFSSYRRLLLDRLSQLVPDWRERNVADGGVALVELLAYVGDHMSYRQDAIATEAYLGTARRRVSMRRHALLVDYEMHDGCNARTFVQMMLAEGAPALVLPTAGTEFLTRCDRVPSSIATTDVVTLRQAFDQHPVVFEPMQDGVTLRVKHNRMQLHAWGDERCCLPKGATRATLFGSYSDLKADDWLLFEEVLGPRSGVAGDADPLHRQVVRLTQVWASIDPLLPGPQDVTEIEWAAADALDFPLCLSSVTDEDHGSKSLSDVSVARGNLVLADHGQRLADEDLGIMPAPRALEIAGEGGHCSSGPRREIPARFRPALQKAPVTQAAIANLAGGAREAMQSTVAGAVPQIQLAGTLDTTDPWQVQRSLLNSDAAQRDFVLEVESDGTASLRFGDGRYGRLPAAGTEFVASYRIGNGPKGNIGADALAHIVGVDVSAIASIRNPLPARGGVDAEGADSVRRRAPEAFRTQERAVTPDDYSSVAERRPGIERASSRLRWTGSWHTMFVTVDRTGGVPADPKFRSDLATYLDRYRMAGHDLEFEEPVHVSLQLDLHVCVKPDYFRADIRQVLNELFSNRVLASGQRALFHPDNFSFGDPVHLSRLLAAAHQVAGVASVEARKFGRQGDDDPQPLADGCLLLAHREIARLDNDPNFPEHGSVQLELHGGK